MKKFISIFCVISIIFVSVACSLQNGITQDELDQAVKDAVASALAVTTTPTGNTTVATATPNVNVTTPPSAASSSTPSNIITQKPSAAPTLTPTIKPVTTPLPTATITPTVKPTAPPTAKPTATSVATPYNPYANVRQYDCITFGKYEQDNNNTNGMEDIEWFVLEVKDRKALVISKYALVCKPYNKFLNNCKWENSSIRDWLNNYFYNIAFDEKEKIRIPTVTVSPEKLSYYHESTGKDTQDKVFLLSESEYRKIPSYVTPTLGGSLYSIKGCNLTKYAKAHSSYWDQTYNDCNWWLRTPLYTKNTALYVHYTGSVSSNGEFVNVEDMGVRPVLWIDLNT